MKTVSIELKHGIAIGETVYKNAELREMSVGDIIDGSEESERLVAKPQGGYVLVESPTHAGINILRRQIVKLGTVEGPIDLSVMRNLNPHDLEFLQVVAEMIEQAGIDRLREIYKDDKALAAAALSQIQEDGPLPETAARGRPDAPPQ
ncbi:MAG: hypothetical protein WD407_08650 [Rhodospirillales bacterium]